MTPDIVFPYLPMEAKLAAKLPTGTDWQYEPKWDGFRCIAFRDGAKIELQSKAGQPLGRYFPEVIAGLAQTAAKRFVLDGELIVAENGKLVFDDLLQRIHPAESRIQTLSRKTPAKLVVFDLLKDEKGTVLTDLPLRERREKLAHFYSNFLSSSEVTEMSSATTDIKVASEWLRTMRGQLDGIVAKRLDENYRSGERAMLKVKNIRSADCVVGGFRYGTGKKTAGSLLLGLYDSEGLLNHVGFTSSMPNSEREELTARLEKLIEPPGFTGRAPGGPSRWSTERSTEWQPLRPELVVEVQYDHFTGERFRHGTKFLRWRPDKAPEQCTVKQVQFESKVSFTLLTARGSSSGI